MGAYVFEDEAVDAKEQILQQYYAKIFRYCYGILRNKQDAEDATQEIF
ncbi:sigma factor [Metasolibacillus sp. FSL K6-0083]